MRAGRRASYLYQPPAKWTLPACFYSLRLLAACPHDADNDVNMMRRTLLRKVGRKAVKQSWRHWDPCFVEQSTFSEP